MSLWPQFWKFYFILLFEYRFGFLPIDWGFVGFGQTTKRAGWVRMDVQNPESIADHMYRMGLMALIASDMPGIDRDKLGFCYFYIICVHLGCFVLLHFVKVRFPLLLCNLCFCFLPISGV